MEKSYSVRCNDAENEERPIPPLNILIKPASGRCTMRCGYCFYFDEMEKRSEPLREMMRPETLEAVVRKSLDFAEGRCTFGFQGGEPTLAGLDFFRNFIALVGEHNRKNLPVDFALQTNGLLLDEAWADFFRENNFLVGVSLDGIREIHDAVRRDAAGAGTHARVLRSIRLLEEKKAQYNILTVVTAQTARHIQKTYRFLMKNGFAYQQYIPCLDPLGVERGGAAHSLTPETYGDFLVKLFDVWIADVAAGKFVSIRFFENLTGMMLGHPPESCGMSGRCVVQHVVESDGSVYPCDFYMLDEYRLGNLAEDSFEDLHRREREIGFIAESLAVEEACKGCEWFPLCRGGCRRDRQGVALHEVGGNHYCASFRRFFAHAAPRLAALLRSLTLFIPLRPCTG